MIRLSQTNTESFDALVFDHRNQAYGAYVLRREYPVQVLKSLLIGVASIASILATPYLSNLFKKEKPNTYYKTWELPPIAPPTVPDDPKINPPKGRKDPPATMSTIFIKPTIVDYDTNDTLPTTIDLNNSNPGYTNSHGDPNFWGIPGDGPDDNGAIVDIPEDIPDAILLADPPSFPGGDEAMRRFLNDNLEYPPHARDIGLEGKVYVTFIVDQFGNLINIETPRPIGGGLDEEAIRVMKLMPRWKPGMQGGYPVKVRYNFPIVFKLN